MANENAVYVTDDRDFPVDRQNQLVIFPGGNGDWYVQIAPVGGVTTEGVRLCTSGGASTAAPGLTAAIADAYRAIKAAESGRPLQPQPSREALQEELDAWRNRFPEFQYRYGMIVED